MHLSIRHMAAFLIILYLLIPVMGFAHAGLADVAAIDISSIGKVAASPCDHCPCSDEKDSQSCDSTSCSCSLHSPPVQGGQVRYAPVVIITRHMESFWMLPQVYSTIYVPPQNWFPDCFSDVSDKGYNIDNVETSLRHTSEKNDRG